MEVWIADIDGGLIIGVLPCFANIGLDGWSKTFDCIVFDLKGRMHEVKLLWKILNLAVLLDDFTRFPR